MFRNQARREPRFTLLQAKQVHVAISHASRPADAFDAELRDLSRAGASLVLSTALQFQDAVVIRLTSAELDMDLSISAEVCWIKPSGDGGWLLGCSFVPQIPEDSLEKLFESGLLERRTYKRVPRRIPVTAQWELDTAVVPAYLWDISEGGFCILSPQPSKAGRRVLISAESGGERIQIPAKTQWEMKAGGGYVVGCEFSSREGYDLVRKIETLIPAVEPSTTGERRASVRQAFRGLVDGLVKRPKASAR